MATLRNGMWVVDDVNRVGVVFRLGPVKGNLERGITALERDEAEVHYADSNGVTITIAPVKLENLCQARWREIPEPRRPDRKRAELLGYV
jgi:hypothetical protein